MDLYPKIVQNLNDKYAIVLGYVAAGNESVIFDNPEECQAVNCGATPNAGFVVLNKDTMNASSWFPTFQEALDTYANSVEKKNITTTEIASFDVGDNRLRILQIGTPNTRKKEIAIDLLLPDGSVQDITVVSANPETGLIDVVVWEDEQDKSFTFSARTPIRQPEDEAEDDSEPITDFSDEYRFLRNSYPAHFEYKGLTFTNAEAAFQSEKVDDDSSRYAFCKLPAHAAKKLGRTVRLRPNWSQMRNEVMENVLRAKFNWENGLAEMLVDTGDREIRPENVRHENYWGVCQCSECAGKKGENHMGKILMKIREELKEDD